MIGAGISALGLYIWDFAVLPKLAMVKEVRKQWLYLSDDFLDKACQLGIDKVGDDTN